MIEFRMQERRGIPTGIEYYLNSIKREGVNMPDFEGAHGNWIWTQDWTEDDKRTARLVYFTKVLIYDDDRHNTDDRYEIAITADCRYKLYVNGELVSYGPAKGDHKVHYLDTVDIGGYLRTGRNRLDVVALHIPEDPKVGNHSFFSSDTPGLYLEGTGLEGWKSRVDRTICFYREDKRFSPLQIFEKTICEDVRGREEGKDTWHPVIVRRNEEMPEYLRTENLKERPIPAMMLKHRELAIPVQVVNPGEEAEFVLDAGEEMCGFVKLSCRGGAGSDITLLYSECYEYENEKGDRTDSEHGILRGYTDSYHIGKASSVKGRISESPVEDPFGEPVRKSSAGLAEESSGEAAKENAGAKCLEPYWFRTFRYIKVTVKNGGEPLFLDRFEYLETGYPLEVRTHAETSDRTLAPVWDISLRTLRRCMHETYVDCPYYEQLQYIMDTRSEILYTYAVSADDRLARKAIAEFSRAQRSDGLLNCSYPNKTVNVIPGFALYYILMVHDHMMYFGDAELVKSVLPVVRRILDFFEERVIREGSFQGLVGKTGGVNEKGVLWSFIDWAQEWMETTGMPRAGLHGPITMESLLYILGLQKAAELEEYAGDAVRAARDRERAEQVQRAVRSICMDREGLLTDGPADMESPDCRMRSQHCQVFGVLTGTLGEEEGRRNLKKSITEEGYAKCSVAMSFYLFRALEQTDLYEYTEQFWDIWRKMVRNNCTTSVEAEFYARSECHAWGALALYELPCAVLGVRPAAPGYSRIEVKPHPGYMTSASGTVHTPVGDVKVSWRKVGEEVEVKTEIIR